MIMRFGFSRRKLTESVVLFLPVFQVGLRWLGVSGQLHLFFEAWLLVSSPFSLFFFPSFSCGCGVLAMGSKMIV